MSRRPADADNDGEGFLGRWSRRKLGGDGPATPVEVEAHDAEPTAPAKSEAAPLTDADMPDIDSIDETSSVADFFSPGVSDGLRRKALRKLFHSPKFNIRDGLDDFDDDYTHFEKLGDVVTADMKHHMELQAERARERALAELEQAAAGDAEQPPAATAQVADAGDDVNGPDDDAPPDDDAGRSAEEGQASAAAAKRGTS